MQVHISLNCLISLINDEYSITFIIVLDFRLSGYRKVLLPNLTTAQYSKAQ